MRPFSKSLTASFIALAVMLALPQVASAQSTGSLSGLFACETIIDKDDQLACFLTETAKLKGVASEKPRDLVVVEKEVVEEIKELKAEKEISEKKVKADKKTKTPKSRMLAIRSTSKVGNRMRFVLENGEVWQQIETERVRLGEATPDMLRIKKASFGSFLGRVNGKGRSFRVRQVD